MGPDPKTTSFPAGHDFKTPREREREKERKKEKERRKEKVLFILVSFEVVLDLSFVTEPYGGHCHWEDMLPCYEWQ